MSMHHRSYTAEVAYPFCWNIRIRPHHVPLSDMYWISPADLHTHHNLLSVLGVGGLGSVLNAVGAQSNKEVCHLTVFQMTFLVLSSCRELQFHVDFD
jgi:hypothetical protein